MSGIANLLGGAGVILGQAGVMNQVGPQLPPRRIYLQESAGKTTFGDTLVGTLDKTFVPPVAIQNIGINQRLVYFTLAKIELVLRRTRTVWQQDSDITATISGPRYDSLNWLEAVRLVLGNPDRQSWGQDFTLVDWGRTSIDLVFPPNSDIDLGTVSSWQPWRSRSTRGGANSVLNLVGNSYWSTWSEFNNCYWNNTFMTEQPNFDVYGAAVSGHSGYIFDQQELQTKRFGVNLSPAVFDVAGNPAATTAIAVAAKLAANPFNFNMRWQIASDVNLNGSYVEFTWAPLSSA